MREWHEVGSLVAGIANHESLVSGSDLLVLFVLVDTLCDFWRLLVDGDDDSCSFIIHADFVGVVSDLLNGLSGDLLEVDLAGGADLSENHAN